MEPAEANILVRHNAAAGRYEAEIDGYLAVAEYLLEGDRVVFTHTFVPPELRGRGVAEKLVRTALEEARQKGRRVVPQCSYVALFIRRNPEFQALVAD
jgi:predicted GNAT family acetyltransferase